MEKIIIEVYVHPQHLRGYRKLVLNEGCKIIKECEFDRENCICAFIETYKHKEDLIVNMAFMTYITNPEFQKYYKI